MVSFPTSLPPFLRRGPFFGKRSSKSRRKPSTSSVVYSKSRGVTVVAMRLFTSSVVLLAVFFYIKCAIGGNLLPFPAWNKGPHRQKTPRRGAVATLSTKCSKIGADILEDGGNAADAVSWAASKEWKIMEFRLTSKQAIAMEFCVGVIGRCFFSL
jgi:hypothetical protein